MLESILNQIECSQILQIDKQQFVRIDLSKENRALSKTDVSDSEKLSNYINSFLAKNKALVAYGGYKEARNLYKRSSSFNSNDLNERFIHLGIDLWTLAYTPIQAPIKGRVHSFNNNAGIGNYGPTIILQHTIKKQKFYTLYGHLTKDSLENLKVGEPIDEGEMFGAIGNYPNNGDYPPHLHFQIIKDLKGNRGDFPGVTSVLNLEEDAKNSPDPNLILKLLSK